MKKRGKYELGIREERGPQAARGVELHKSFEEAISTGSALPPEFTLYDDYVVALRAAGALPELKVAVDRSWKPLPFDSPDAWIIGILDLWLVRGTRADGWDWKSGKIYDDHVKQKEFYTCLLADACPEVEEFTFTNVYIDLGKNIPHKFTRQEVLETLRPRWQSRIELMERDTECAPTPSYACRWCPVSKAKGGPCPF
jgi:hypothetical protein